MRTASIFGAVIAVAIAPSGNLARAQCELNEDAKVIASDAGEDDRFGQVVAISGNLAVVGHRGTTDRPDSIKDRFTCLM